MDRPEQIVEKPLAASHLRHIFGPPDSMQIRREPFVECFLRTSRLRNRDAFVDQAAGAFNRFDQRYATAISEWEKRNPVGWTI